MTLDAFWKTIDSARQASGQLVQMPAHLGNVLSAAQEREIVDYETHFRVCMHRAYDANVWLGAVVILGGCGDDTFTDFRCWLIAQGQEAFEAALADPDSMAALDCSGGDHGYPILFDLNYVGRSTFCRRVAGNPRDFEAGERFASFFPHRKHPELKNPELINTSDEDAKLLFPKLAARFPKGMRSY